MDKIQDDIYLSQHITTKFGLPTSAGNRIWIYAYVAYIDDTMMIMNDRLIT